MKILILVLAAGLLVGCAHDRVTVGGDEDAMDFRSGMDGPGGSSMLNPWQYTPPGSNGGR